MLAVFRNVDLGDIRVIKDKNNEPLFCLSDICKTLDIQDTYKVKQAILREFELSTLSVGSFETGFGVKQFTMIDEAQLYYVLNTSRSPKAKPFRMWVNKEVLPRIRKTGEYSLKQVLPKNYEEALEHLLAQVKENKKLQQERTALLQSETKLKRLMHSGLTYTSTQIAKELGLSSAKELHRILNIANIICESPPLKKWELPN